MFGRKAAEQQTTAKAICQKVTEHRVFNPFCTFRCHLSKVIKQQKQSKTIYQPHYPENYPQI